MNNRLECSCPISTDGCRCGNTAKILEQMRIQRVEAFNKRHGRPLNCEDPYFLLKETASISKDVVDFLNKTGGCKE